jgi:hypothetical protein
LEGNATYKIANSNPVSVNLPDGECLVFLIACGFTVDNDTYTIKNKGRGHIVQGASVLTLESATAIILISGY